MTSLLERIQRNLPERRRRPHPILKHLVVMVDGRVDDVTKLSPLIEQFARRIRRGRSATGSPPTARTASGSSNAAQWLLLRAA